MSIIHEGKRVSIFSHIKLIYTNSVINIGTKLCNKMPGYIEEMVNYEEFKKELK